MTEARDHKEAEGGVVSDFSCIPLRRSSGTRLADPRSAYNRGSATSAGKATASARRPPSFRCTIPSAEAGARVVAARCAGGDDQTQPGRTAVASSRHEGGFPHSKSRRHLALHEGRGDLTVRRRPLGTCTPRTSSATRRAELALRIIVEGVFDSQPAFAWVSRSRYGGVDVVGCTA